MKVAVVTQYFPTSVQPWAGHSAYQTLRQLAGLCDLHVFYPDATYPKLLKPSTRPAAALDPSWSPPDVPVTYIPYTALPVVSRPLNGLAIAQRMMSHVRQFAPNIILNYVVYPDGFAAVRIGRRLGIPTVLTAIGSDLNRIPGAMVTALTRYTLARASFVTTVSNDLAQTALTLGARSGRIQAILNGCDTSVFHPQDTFAARQALGLNPEAQSENQTLTEAQTDPQIIVYVGRLDIRKGLMELISAMAALRLKRPGVHCYIVGDGPDRAMLVEAIARTGTGATVTLIPACPTAQVALWMAAADVVTLPSYREGCPNVVIEGLAAGRPIVATNVGGIPELMDETCGRLIPPQDAQALTLALDEVLNKTWDAAAISGRHSRSWANVAADLYAVLERTVSQCSTPTRAFRIR